LLLLFRIQFFFTYLWTFHMVEKRPHNDEFDPGRAAVTWFLVVNS
jgi:hypothetical protein